MYSLYTISSDKAKERVVLGESEKFSVFYHDLFDFPLTFADIIKWKASENSNASRIRNLPIVFKNGYYFLSGREGLVYKKALRGRISAKKIEIAKKASGVLSLIPSVKLVAVTGSLTMGNAGDEGDIDLLVIVKKGLLWTTRMLSYLVLKIFGFELRSAGNSSQKNKLCLNMWLDEKDLIWKKGDRNLYTAHEIAQILPLVSKNNTYENFLYRNKWILEFWPNSVRISTPPMGSYPESRNSIISLVEKVCYKIQYSYMKSRITREIATPTRAIFHPQDWGKVVLSRLNTKNGIF